MNILVLNTAAHTIGASVASSKLGELYGNQWIWSAWLTQRLGRPPQHGDVYEEANTIFTVRRIRRGKVFEAAVSRRENTST